jgi:hypothetical protein
MCSCSEHLHKVTFVVVVIIEINLNCLPQLINGCQSSLNPGHKKTNTSHEERPGRNAHVFTTLRFNLMNLLKWAPHAYQYTLWLPTLRFYWFIA